MATALRRIGQIDAVIAALAKSTPTDVIRDCLRLGAAQVLFPWAPHPMRLWGQQSGRARLRVASSA